MTLLLLPLILRLKKQDRLPNIAISLFVDLIIWSIIANPAM